MRILSIVLIAFSATTVADDEHVSLWEAKGDTNSIYLLGSLHMLRENDHPLPDVIEAAYQDAESIIMEVDMDDIDPMATMTLMTEEGLIQDGRTLKDWMGEDAWLRAESTAKKLDLPLQMMSRVEPWYAAMTAELMLLSRIGFDANHGVESYFSNKASADNKTISGLETLTEQIGFLNGLSLPAQRDMLLSTLEESQHLEETMDELIVAWHAGDTDFFEQELLPQFEQHEELYKVIIVDRNSRWIEQIVELLDDDDDYLIVVGVAHLAGRHGVPKLLRDRGVTIRQLRKSTALR